MSGYVCTTCGSSWPDLSDFDARRQLAQHRQFHDYQRRRRSSWRESKRRKLARLQHPDAIGALHSLSCSGPPHRARPSCRPIPVFDHPLR